MSLQMSLVFGTLIVQMSTLLFLVLPLPFPVRNHIVGIANSLKKLKNFKVGVVFSIILLGLQFLDCVNRLERYRHIGNPYFVLSAKDADFGAISYDQLASKFYSQRNLYLTGAVLYLELAINTIVSILEKWVKKETEYRLLTSKSSDKTKDDSLVIEDYKKQIKSKETDIQTLKKQIQGLQTSYDSLNPTTSIKKDD